MNDQARQKLCEIILRYGRQACIETKRCRGLLQDGFANEHKREFHALVSALEEQVPAELYSGLGGQRWEIMARRLVRRLVDNRPMTEDAASWAVESWALALGVRAEPPIPPLSQPHSSPGRSGPGRSDLDNTRFGQIRSKPVSHGTADDSDYHNISDAQIRRLAEFFRQAADSTRLRTLLLLEEGPRNVGELCVQLRQSQPAVSHHLAKMRSFDLVESNRSGQNVIYSATDAGSRLARLVPDQDTSTSSRSVELFRQVADPTRLRILLLLAERERNVGELCSALTQSQPAVSHHLAKMRAFGIVEAGRSGKYVYYSITELGTKLVRMISSLPR